MAICGGGNWHGVGFPYANGITRLQYMRIYSGLTFNYKNVYAVCFVVKGVRGLGGVVKFPY